MERQNLSFARENNQGPDAGAFVQTRSSIQGHLLPSALWPSFGWPGAPQVCRRLCFPVAGALRSQRELENRLRVSSQTLPRIDFSRKIEGIT